MPWSVLAILSGPNPGIYMARDSEVFLFTEIVMANTSPIFEISLGYLFLHLCHLIVR